MMLCASRKTKSYRSGFDDSAAQEINAKQSKTKQGNGRAAIGKGARTDGDAMTTFRVMRKRSKVLNISVRMIIIVIEIKVNSVRAVRLA